MPGGGVFLSLLTEEAKPQWIVLPVQGHGTSKYWEWEGSLPKLGDSDCEMPKI